MERLKAAIAVFGSLFFIVVLTEASVGGRSVSDLISGWTLRFFPKEAQGPVTAVSATPVRARSIPQTALSSVLHSAARVPMPAPLPLKEEKVQNLVTKRMQGALSVVAKDPEQMVLERNRQRVETDFFISDNPMSAKSEFGEKTAKMNLDIKAPFELDRPEVSGDVSGEVSGLPDGIDVSADTEDFFD